MYHTCKAGSREFSSFGEPQGKPCEGGTQLRLRDKLAVLWHYYHKVARPTESDNKELSCASTLSMTAERHSGISAN
jgi:hypothetical protein